MTLLLDRADIQGNVLQPYGRNTYPMGNLLLFHLQNRCASAGAPRNGQGGDARMFLRNLLPQISTAELFQSKRTSSWFPGDGDRLLPRPSPLTVNVAFTYRGLAALGVPQSTLSGFPTEFQEGMRARAAVLNDDPELWDPAWREEANDTEIHLLILLRVNIKIILNRIHKNKPAENRQSRSEPYSGSGYHHPDILESARQTALKRLNLRSELLIRKALSHGLTLLSGHASDGEDSLPQRWQFMESLLRSRKEDDPFTHDGDDDNEPQYQRDKRYSEYEHFGFFDGIGDPVFAGQYPVQDQDEEVIGQGRRIGRDGSRPAGWQPLATGEFLLGYPDEAQEMPAAAVPLSFSRNGTFLVVRKLHQHVARFERSLAEQLPAFQAWLEGRDPQAHTAAGDADLRAAASLLRSKLLGRWPDGTPLAIAPTYEAWEEFQRRFRELRIAVRRGQAAHEELVRFKRQFRDFSFEPRDHEGGSCPFTAHIRRCNPRDSGDPSLSDQAGEEERDRASSVLVNRRRLLRRGMTYGEPWPRPCDLRAPAEAYGDDGKERGVLFIALCTSLLRQFEFVQQQWLNYGSDFGAGNDVCPISGVTDSESQRSKLVIAPPEDSPGPPFVLRPAAAVTCRGGGYFFLPSLTALRQIAQGIIDPI